MAGQEVGGTGVGGPGGEPLAWDFRLDRSGLIVNAGRYLRLQISLGLLFWLIALCAGWGAYRWNLPPLP